MELTVLGCNSALPTSTRNPSAQILSVSGRIFLIDCGEGTQFQLRKMHINFMRINHIFISHLHGDHLFGLIGLISTMSLLNRSTPLVIFADERLEPMLRQQVEFFCDNLSYAIEFRPLNFDTPQVILNIKGVMVQSVPLKHRQPTCGFIFREQPKEANIRRDAICRFGLSFVDMAAIKAGKPFFDINGDEVPRSELVVEPPVPKSYAYISDTSYQPDIVPLIRNVSLLYHEATFGEEHIALARKTLHSTAAQAATIARMAEVSKLLIGHFSSRYRETDDLEQEAQNIFANTTAVFDGFKIVF